MASDTPRTDAAMENEALCNYCIADYARLRDCSRQLERELSAAQSQIAALNDRVSIYMQTADEFRRENEALKVALAAAKIPHHTCEDCWYSCPKSPDGCCNEHSGDECTCGADKHNAAIDAAMKAKP